MPPFPFSDEVRTIAVEKLFSDVRASLLVQSAWIRLTLHHNIPASQCSDQGIVQLTYLLLVCVNKFHLTRSIRGCGPLLPPKIEGWLRDLREYLPHDDTWFPSTDVWEKDKGNLLRLACWLHCLNMAFTYSRGTAQSLRRKDHEETGNLLCFLLAPRLGPLTSVDMIDRVLQENRDDTLRQLKEAKDGLETGKVRVPKLEKEITEAKRELKHIKRQHTAQPSDVQCSQRKCKHLQQEKEEKEEYLKQCRYEVAYCQHYLDKWPPGEAPEWAAFALGELLHQPITPMVDPLPGAKGYTCSGSQNPATGEDVQMQDNTPQGAVGSEGATGGVSPINKENKALLNEVETPQTQVISDMRNLMVCSPPNPTSSQSEIKLQIPCIKDGQYLNFTLSQTQ